MTHIGAGNHAWDFLLYYEALIAAGKPIAEVEKEVDVLRIAHLVPQGAQEKRMLIWENLHPGAALADGDTQHFSQLHQLLLAAALIELGTD
jgi:hypothetical protein